MTRSQRALVYGLLGWATEVGFTGVQAVLRRPRDLRLQGHSYLWMLPIYGLVAYLFEPMHDAVRNRPLWQRAITYAGGFLSVEYASGTALKRGVGLVPWDYTGRSRWVVPGGAMRVDYAPLWGIAGLALEHVDDALRAAPLRRST